MYTLNEIQREAEVRAGEIEIQWDAINDKQFEDALTLGTVLIPELETLYTKLISGSSVAFEGEESPLSVEDKEKYTELVGDQLFEAYTIREVLHKFRCITNIIKLANPLDNAD